MSSTSIGGSDLFFDGCSHCLKKASRAPGPLKRCGGCEIARYCSKECQKAAWVWHKKHCRPRNASEDPHCIQQYGYPSLISLADALQSWFRAHQFSLNLIANLHVFTSGGLDYVFSSPRAIVIKVTPGPFDPDRNPATGFRVERIGLRDQGDEWGIEEDSVKSAQQGCKRQAKVALKAFPRTLAGVLPIVFHALGTGLTLAFQHPVFHIPGISQGIMDNSMRLVLDDLYMICLATMDDGYSFSSPDYAAGEYVPMVLEMKKERKKWKWVPVEDRDVWATIASRMRESPSMNKTGLHPRDIWSIFYRAIQG